MQINFSVPGQPTPLARARHGKGRTYEAKGMASSKSDVANAYLDALRSYVADGPPIGPHEGPVTISILSVFLAPKDCWPGRECTKRPDLDNLCKLVCDALNGVAYRDDSQIICAILRKQFGEIAETHVSINLEPTVPRPAKIRARRQK